MPDFRGMPNLERLSFEGCVELEQMDTSIGVLKKLVILNLSYCKKLVSLPNSIFSLSSLECLNLPGFPKVFKSPSENASHSQSTMSSILKWTTSHFHSLYPNEHKDLSSCLLPSLLSLSTLIILDISFIGLSQLPDAIGCLHWLEELKIGGNSFKTIPSLKELSRLAYLNLEHCKLLESLPQLPFPTVIIVRDLSINNYENKKGLVIFNCPKLGERERCSSITYLWMIQFIQANLQHRFISDHIHFVVPRSEMPSWCNNTSEGSSIRIDPSPIMCDNDKNFIGIACCAVFSVVPDDQIMTTKKYANIVIKLSNGSTIWCSNVVPVTLERDLIEVKSDHMCLICIPQEALLFGNLKFIEKNLWSLDHFFMNFAIECCQGLSLEVQKCGYGWIYKQDLQLLHSSGNSLARKCKFLANEDGAQPQSFI